MKIKTWLLLSYVIVMLLPLGAAYGLFAWINSYHQERSVAEYLDNWSELQTIKTTLRDPSLYQPNADWTSVEELTNERLSIALYSNSGLMLYSSNPVYSPLTFTNKEQLYREFYSLRQQFGTFTYKEPVFTGGSALVGIFEIQMIREEWVSGVEQRTWLVIAGFALFFIVLFIGVVLLVNRKLNRPLQLLMGQMELFAKGEQVRPLPKRKDEIGELSASFEAMQKELEAAQEKLDQEQQQKEFMIASISHDLKTPLTSIRAYAEALQAGNMSLNEQHEYREVIISKANYMKQMLDDLLMYTLLQSHSYEMELVVVDGEEFFEMLVSDYQTLCDEKQIQLDVACSVAGSYAVNSKQLMRVVDNLMSNAITHTNEGGRIGLAAVNKAEVPKWCFNVVKTYLTKEDGVYLLVQNSGSSITEEELRNVFNPLFQADRARTKAGERGTGLGLSITKQIIEKHGGTVQMVSAPGMGTAVICWLPGLEGDEQS